MDKERLDILVQRLAGVSRSKAQGLILTGQVFAGERKLDKPGLRVPADTALPSSTKAGASGEERR